MRERSHRSKSRKIRWERFRLLPLPGLTSFKPLFSFVNHSDINEETWKDLLWQAMGREKMCVGTYVTSEGTIKKRTWASEFAGDEEAQELTPYIPKIFGQEASRDLTKTLQEKIRQALDLFVSKTGSVNRQRNGFESSDWMKRAREHDLTFKLTGIASPYLTLPWSSTHFEEHNEIVDFILREFNAQESREAIIHRGDFLCFVDEGEDATRTLSWMLILLTELAFERERVVLKKCRFCENYFIHETLKRKEFCKSTCRYDYNNKIRG